MPIQRSEKEYECSICHKIWDRILYADSCEKSHEIIYVPLKKEDIIHLVQFLYTGDKEMLNLCQNAIKILMSYTRK